MRYILLFLIINYTLQAQTNVSDGDRDTSLLRIDFGLNFDYHYVWSNTKGQLGATQDVLYKNVAHELISFTVPDVQIILKDKLGISTGFYFLSGSSDSKKIEEFYQSTEKTYYTQLANADYAGGRSPVRGDYNFSTFKLGALGFFRTYRNLVLIPSINYLMNIESRYPEFEIRYKEPGSNYMFTRTFYAEHVSCKGGNANLRAMLYFNSFGGKKNVGGAIIGFNIGYSYLKSSAEVRYKDKDIYNIETISPSTKVNKDFSSIYIGFILGVTFHRNPSH